MKVWVTRDKAQELVHIRNKCPKEHFATIEDVNDSDILSHIFFKVIEIAKNRGLKDYRIIINKGEKAGQTVFHLHIHIIGGRELQWPPG